jgi:hypothetical protein
MWLGYQIGLVPDTGCSRRRNGNTSAGLEQQRRFGLDRRLRPIKRTMSVPLSRMRAEGHGVCEDVWLNYARKRDATGEAWTTGDGKRILRGGGFSSKPHSLRAALTIQALGYGGSASGLPER